MSLQLSATTVRVVHPSSCPDIGPVCSERDEPPQQHDQRFYVAELRPALSYALARRLSLEVQLPLRVNITTIRYLREDGTPFVPDYPNIHHRNETIKGFGDPWLTARTRHGAAGFELEGFAGVTLPLGRTHENPFRLGEQGLEHQHVQLGTGTFTPVLGFDVNRSGLPRGLDVRAHAQVQLSLYENHHGYRAGARTLGGVELGARVSAPLRIAATFDVFREEAERWDGLILQDGNLGRTDLLLGVSGTVGLGRRYALSGAVKVPVYQDIAHGAGHEAGQLTYPAIVTFAVQRTLGLL